MLPALMSIGLLAGCGGGLASMTSDAPVTVAGQSDAVPAPRMLTPKNDRGVYTIAVGRSVGLVVPDPYAPDPEVDGQSIRVVEVSNIDASNRREWELRAVKPGRTVISAGGKLPYTITLEVQ
jgi:hypothetical protein